MIALSSSSSFVLLVAVMIHSITHSFAFTSSRLLLKHTRAVVTPSLWKSNLALFSHSKGDHTMKPKVLVAVADGTEEIEAVTIIDTLVRGGAEVTVASVMDRLEVICSRGVKIVGDCHIEECRSKEWDLICCPGGMPGATHLSNSEALTNLLVTQNHNKKLIAAICAAPAVVLARHNLLHDRTATCYPADKFTSQLRPYSTDNVVVDHHIITSRGPGTALEFSLRLVGILFGHEKENLLKREMLFHA